MRKKMFTFIIMLITVSLFYLQNIYANETEKANITVYDSEGFPIVSSNYVLDATDVTLIDVPNLAKAVSIEMLSTYPNSYWECYLDEEKCLDNYIEISDINEINVKLLNSNNDSLIEEYKIKISRLGSKEETKKGIIYYSEIVEENNFDNIIKENEEIVPTSTTIYVDKNTIGVVFRPEFLYRYESAIIRYNGYSKSLDGEIDDFYLKLNDDSINKVEIEVIDEAGNTDVYHIDFVKSNKNEVQFIISENKYIYNNKVIETDVAPIIVNGRTLLPLRVLGNSLGAVVEWDSKSKTVTVKKDEKNVNIKINQELPNGMGMAVMINNKVYIPVRYVAEVFDAEVTYDEQNRAISIIYK